MQNIIMSQFVLVGVLLLSVGSVFAGPVPVTPTAVGGDLWPSLTTGAVLGVGAW